MRHLTIALLTISLGAATPGAIPNAEATPSGNTVTITAVDQGGYDRVSITFSGPTISITINANANAPHLIPADKDHPIPGATYYIHGHRYPTPPIDSITNHAATIGLPAVQGVLTQYYEGELAIDIGLARQSTYQVSADEHTIYLNIAH
jgi:hypothetical protein